MASNAPLREHIEDVLSRAAGIDESRICVAADDGGVTLIGPIASYYQDIKAEQDHLRPHHARSTSTSPSGYDLTPLDGKARERAADAAGLNDEERRILLDRETERPGCGLLLRNKANGTYACNLCGLPLFTSESKFKSCTGWLSFFQPVDPAHIREMRDTSYGMVRVEARCARCDSHLGHLFPDGPAVTGNRYSMNSGALEFMAEGVKPEQRTASEFAVG